jgi:hypothetical protein
MFPLDVVEPVGKRGVRWRHRSTCKWRCETLSRNHPVGIQTHQELERRLALQISIGSAGSKSRHRPHYFADAAEGCGNLRPYRRCMGAHPRCAIPVAAALRHALIELAGARNAQLGQQTTMELVCLRAKGCRYCEVNSLVADCVFRQGSP